MEKIILKSNLLLVLLLSMTSVFAQKQITGKVTSSTSEPLPGVSVIVKGSTNGTSTDINGNYTISQVPESATIVFSYLGFESAEVVVTDQSVINVTLSEDVKLLNDVVVVGYGTQKKVNLTGSVVAIDSKQIENRPAATVSSLLAGQAPGLTVIQSGGNPGRNSGSLNIRGIGSLNNSDPLIIVDGIETGSISEINPEDIENVSILKDASSSAIYGIRAANGVVLITTKRGKKNTELQVKYNSQFGVTDFISFANKVNSFDLATLHNEANANDGTALFFSSDDLMKFKNGSSPLTHANTNHIDEVFSKNGVWQSHNLSFAGGSDKGSYNISLGYLDEEGLINNTGLKRYSLRTNLDRDITDKLKVGLNISGTYNRVTDPSAGIGWVTHTAFREWATDVIQYPDGRWANPTWSGQEHNSKAYASDDMGVQTTKDTRIITTGFVEYEIISGLKVKGIASVLADRNKTSSIIHGVDLYRINKSTGEIDANPSSTTINLNSDSPLVDKVSRGYFDNTDINLQLLLNYEKTFGKHSIKTLLGYEQREIESEYANLSRRGLLDKSLDQINAADPSQDDTSGNTSEFRSRSGFTRLNYNFDERYLFEANVRYDGTSRFDKDLRFDYFPSFSVGWRISEEKFFDVPIVSNLKLKASWGKLGNQEIANYLFLSTYRLGSSYIFGGEEVSGINEGAIANKNLEWEKTTSKNLGIDLGLMNSKFNLSADYFIKNTDDILFTLPKPGVLGAASPVENVASVKNKGFEIAAQYRDQIGQVNFYINANISKVKNEITDLAGAETPGREIGDPIRNLYGYRTDGLFASQNEIDAYGIDQSSLGGNPKPGDIKYLDITGDGIVNADDRESIGSPFPEVTYGFSFGLDYKGFDFSTVWQGVGNVKTMIAGRLQRPFWLGSSPLDPQLDRWSPQNLNARYPRSSFANQANYVESDFWLEDASYLKLRNVQLGYTLPKSISDKIGFEKLRLYVTGENLLTISSFKKDFGFDPEDVTGAGDPLFFAGSNTANNYPTTKRYIVGLNLTF